VLTTAKVKVWLAVWRLTDFFLTFFKTVSTPFPGIEDVKNFISPVSLFPDICKLGLTCFFVEKNGFERFLLKKYFVFKSFLRHVSSLRSFPSPKS